MRSKLFLLVAGFALGVVSTVGAIFALLSTGTSPTMTIHEAKLGSSKTVKVTMCNLVWGVGHTESERDMSQDQFQLDFVSSKPNLDSKARDREVLEAFELIRPVTEQWGIKKATVSVFPTAQRKGRYDIYTFQQNADGQWNSDQHPAKVHIND
jgi:hypothetical protein